MAVHQAVVASLSSQVASGAAVQKVQVAWGDAEEQQRESGACEVRVVCEVADPGGEELAEVTGGWAAGRGESGAAGPGSSGRAGQGVPGAAAPCRGAASSAARVARAVGQVASTNPAAEKPNRRPMVRGRFSARLITPGVPRPFAVYFTCADAYGCTTAPRASASRWRTARARSGKAGWDCR